MNEQLTIDTPEALELNYGLAGVGSRLCAAFLDFLIVAAVEIAVGFIVFGPIGTSFLSGWMITITSIVAFAIFWGYYLFFDMVQNGQSPGKRVLGLRVIQESGYAVSFTSSAVRNLIRIVDFLPSFYIVGFLVMMFDRKWRRLGDFAAGTLVVREQSLNSPAQLAVPIEARTVLKYGEAILLDQVTDAEMSAIREYLTRRPILTIPHRTKIARVIGEPIAQRMGFPKPPDFNLFLEELYLLANQKRL